MESAEKFFKGFPKVELTDEGIFKYIHILVKLRPSNTILSFVRGYIDLEYHAENLERFEKQIQQAILQLGDIKLDQTFEIQCPGGGRVNHSKANRKLSIYGFSQSFGAANHDQVKDIVFEELGYPKANISVSYDGY